MEPDTVSESKPVDYKLGKVDYLMGRTREGKILYSNFQAMKNVGVSPYIKTKPVRPKLGDYEHLSFMALWLFSILSLSPSFAYEFYRLGKIIGYCTADGALRSLKLRSIVDVLNKRNLFWKVMQDEHIKDALRKGWEADAGISLDLLEMDKKNKKMKYAMKDNSCRVIKTLIDRYGHEYFDKPGNLIEIGILCGQMDALLGSFWNAYESTCCVKGDEVCTIELYRHDKEETPRISVLSKQDHERLLDICIALITSQDKGLDRDSGDLGIISMSQALNYLLLSKSKGHRVLSKWSGRKVGKKVAKKAGLSDPVGTLDYLSQMFLDLKTCIMSNEIEPEKITVRLEECVYSAGVENIGMKLCAFMAGIVKGALFEATGVQWLVKETKCVANGDEVCTLVCTTREPGELRKMLLGGT